ncbi:hypothetical protein KUTeg_014313 [Tegillarca granosa]|uniref:BTB domain-containing protein n=1 Tax=Tegillarca granosa TaxID=220873 RepID=A0ABQ9EW77_TEGGR|nr:hypothetical protein KUTeg_014313 [Tegillarca granosa]
MKYGKQVLKYLKYSKCRQKLYNGSMDRPMKSEPKSCLPFKPSREFSDDEMNQEVPQNFVGKLTVQRPLRKQEPSWKTPQNSPKVLPTAKTSEEFNWQANQNTLQERNAVMFNNPLMADVYFIVGSEPSQQRIPAHKYVLATSSSVFHAMFYGGLANQTNDIKIPDVEPCAFLNLLRLFEEQELMQRCWEVIDAQAEEALKSDGFTEMDLNTLKTVLTRETINAKELSLFNAVCRWAEAECRRQEVEPTAENKRTVLGDALNLIRVPTMSLEEFANGPAQSGILNLQETNDVFLHYLAKNKPELSFSKKKRTGLTPHKCHRFQSSAYRSNQWRYRGRCDSIQFAVDHRIFVAGLGLYGSSNGATDYQVKIELKKNGMVLGQTIARFFCDGSSNTFPVMFENPIQIEPEIFYTASAVLDGAELSYFGQEGLAEVQCDKVTFQFQCSSDSTNGTGVQGGQIPEIIFFC